MAAPPLLVISPMFPPMEGGLPHHTDALAGVLSAHFQVTLLTSTGVETDRSFKIAATIGNWQAPDDIQRAATGLAPAGPVLWQYVPHMYGRGGMNLRLPQVWRAFHQQGRRQVFIAHEIRAPLSLWPHRLAYALSHRWMWRAVRAHADAVGVSTAGWLERPDTMGGRPEKFFLAPSPSNLPLVPVGPDHARRWRADHDLGDVRRVLGFFGSPGTGKQFDWVLAAWRAARRTEPATALVIIGGKPEVALASDEQRWFRPLGYLALREASEALQALDVLGLPFVDGVSERRSSFMAGLAHGVPIVTLLGPATGAELRTTDGFVGVAATVDDYAASVTALLGDPDRRRALARRSRERYASRYDWPCLAELLRQRLVPAK